MFQTVAQELVPPLHATFLGHSATSFGKQRLLLARDQNSTNGRSALLDVQTAALLLTLRWRLHSWPTASRQ